MTSEPNQEVTGTFIRGADGSLYFIPEAELAAFRVPEEAAAEAERLLDQPDEVQGYGAALPFIQPLTAVQAIIIIDKASAIVIHGRAPSA